MEDKTCPVCEETMMLKKSHQTDELFWLCDCGHTEDCDVDD